MSPGIPPSLDRKEQQAALLVGGAIVVAMFLALLYVAVGWVNGAGITESGQPSSGSERLDDYLEEEERASAYATLRDHLDQYKNEPGYEAVFCRDTSHYWADGAIVMEGQVDFQMETGELAPHRYHARLTGSRQHGWEVLSVELVPLDDDPGSLP